MLFTYSPNALAENWLNSAIVSILNEGMTNILSGQRMVSWPRNIPLEHRELLRNRRGIRDRLTVFWREYANLERQHQEALLVAMREQTSLPEVFSNDAVCPKIDTFPDVIRVIIDDLFRFLFEKQLSSIIVREKSLRDLHYESIYFSVPSHVCPFCGLGHLRAPG
ncbi:TPA: hypothetical protein MCA30_005543, partial [Klebsiella pneumoniae]|nr:hypothetical protein [Klebsiella pneumoniae]